MIWMMLWVLLGTLVNVLHAEMPMSLRTLLPPGAQVSLIVQPVHASEPLYAWQPDTLRLPASTLKLLTALGVTFYLGHDYRFETRLMVAEGVQHARVIKFRSDGLLAASCEMSTQQSLEK